MTKGEFAEKCRLDNEYLEVGSLLDCKNSEEFQKELAVCYEKINVAKVFNKRGGRRDGIALILCGLIFIGLGIGLAIEQFMFGSLGGIGLLVFALAGLLAVLGGVILIILDFRPTNYIFYSKNGTPCVISWSKYYVRYRHMFADDELSYEIDKKTKSGELKNIKKKDCDKIAYRPQVEFLTLKASKKGTYRASYFYKPIPKSKELFFDGTDEQAFVVFKNKKVVCSIIEELSGGGEGGGRTSLYHFSKINDANLIIHVPTQFKESIVEDLPEYLSVKYVDILELRKKENKKQFRNFKKELARRK